MKNFYEFINEKSIEVGDNLKKLLSGNDDKFSKNLITFLNSDNIKDEFGYDKIEWFDDDAKLLTIYDNKGKGRKVKLGKLLKTLGYDKPYSDYEVENFINNLKKSDTSGLKLFKGDDIYWVYNCKNYVSEEGISVKGDLFTSCMRFDSTNKFLEIYAKNPNQCQVLALIKDGKVAGRALIWTNYEDVKFMDRIYVADKNDMNIYTSYQTENKISSIPIEIELDNNGEYDYYPYMDSLEYYNTETGILSPEEDSESLYLKNTDGGSSGGANMVFSHFRGENIPDSEAGYSEIMGDWAYHDDMVYSAIYDDNIIIKSDKVVELKFYINSGSLKDDIEYKYALLEDTFEVAGMYFYNDGVNAGIFDENLEYILYEKIEQMFGEFTNYYDDIQDILKINGIIASNYGLLIKEDSSIEEIDTDEYDNIRSLGSFDSHPILNTKYTGAIYNSYVHFYADEVLSDSRGYIETDKVKFSSFENCYIYLKDGEYKVIGNKHINDNKYRKYISNEYFSEAKYEDFGDGLFLPTSEVKKEHISFLLDIFRRNNISNYMFNIYGKNIRSIDINNKDIIIKNDSFKINGEYFEQKDVEKQILRKDEGFVTDFKTFIQIYS